LFPRYERLSHIDAEIQKIRGGTLFTFILSFFFVEKRLQEPFFVRFSSFEKLSGGGKFSLAQQFIKDKGFKSKLQF